MVGLTRVSLLGRWLVRGGLLKSVRMHGARYDGMWLASHQHYSFTTRAKIPWDHLLFYYVGILKLRMINRYGRSLRQYN